MLKQPFAYYSKAVPKALCKYLIATIPLDKANEATVSDESDAHTNHDQRKTDVTFVSPLSAAGSMLQSHMRDANLRAGWNFELLYPENIQMGRYTEGGHYDWHIDSFAPNENNLQRKLTAVLFLSAPDSYEGGDFELRIAPGLPKHPEQGDIIVFPSVLEHRVTPVLGGERFTAVCWMTGPAFR